MTKALKLNRDGDGYFRCTWYAADGVKHRKSFGNVRSVAQERFAAFFADWQADERVKNPRAQATATTIEEGYQSFLRWADTHYRDPRGNPTREVGNFCDAMRDVLTMFGATRAAEFGPRKLERVRNLMIEYGDLSRTTINARIKRVRAVFRWMASAEIVQASVPDALATLKPLTAGRAVRNDEGELMTPRESEPVTPADLRHVAAAMCVAVPVLRDMIRLQWLTGMRPGELCDLRPCHIDKRNGLWRYQPERHKTERKGGRLVLIGPRGQRLLRKYLERDPRAHCFSPREALEQKWARSDTHRREGQKPTERATGRIVGTRYRTGSYARAIYYACQAAGVPVWSPNQLRHNAATRIRAKFGLEAAKAVLGHAKVETTQIYAEKDLAAAAEAMEKLG